MCCLGIVIVILVMIDDVWILSVSADFLAEMRLTCAVRVS